MSRKCISKLIGRNCKIIAREPGEKNPFIVSGVLTDFNEKNGHLVIESKEGIGIININTVEAIKPKLKN